MKLSSEQRKAVCERVGVIVQSCSEQVMVWNEGRDHRGYFMQVLKEHTLIPARLGLFVCSPDALPESDENSRTVKAFCALSIMDDPHPLTSASSKTGLLWQFNGTVTPLV